MSRRMSIETKFKPEDLAKISGVNLIININKEIKKVKEKLEKFGLSYAKSGLEKDVMDITMIVETTGDPIANDLLVKKLNKLDYTINRDFPYLPLVKKQTFEVFSAYKLALAKHFQQFTGIKNKAMLKLLRSDAVLSIPKTHFLSRLMKSRDEELSEGI